MPLTLGMTGMDPATEAALKAAVEEANATLAQPWQLLPEMDADHVVVDMDSMYGPMSWLRLHAAGKRVIGLSTAARTQTDFHLSRPFDAGSVAALLQSVATAGGNTATGSGQPGAGAGGTAAAIETEDALAQGPARDRAGSDSAGPAASTPLLSATPAIDAVDADDDPVAPQPPPPGETEPPPPPAQRRLSEWLVPGALSGRVRYRPDGGDALLIDAEKRQYHGPPTLKPLAGHFSEVLEIDAFTPLDDDAWNAQRAESGPAQPLSRLQWYGGLLAGKGKLLPGFDPDGRYRLGKWPQTEREFPRHFRLATTMMKGPATLEEIAAASGVPVPEVADFINANLASGYAEFVPEPPPEPTEPSKPAGLFGRLRGR